MSFGGEDVGVGINDQVFFLGKEQEEIFEHFGEEEGIHPVFVRLFPHVLDSRKAARNSGMLFKRFNDILANLNSRYKSDSKTLPPQIIAFANYSAGEKNLANRVRNRWLA